MRAKESCGAADATWPTKPNARGQLLARRPKSMAALAVDNTARSRLWLAWPACFCRSSCIHSHCKYLINGRIPRHCPRFGALVPLGFPSFPVAVTFAVRNVLYHGRRGQAPIHSTLHDTRILRITETPPAEESASKWPCFLASSRCACEPYNPAPPPISFR